MMTPVTTGKQDDEDGEIDWEQVDTDGIEREAIASTPGSSQRSAVAVGASISTLEGNSLSERMRTVIKDGAKRKREDEPLTPQRHEVSYYYCARTRH